MFSKDISHYRKTPRNMNEAFGAYARLTVERRQKIKAWVCMLATGVCVGAGWWLVTALKAGA